MRLCGALLSLSVAGSLARGQTQLTVARTYDRHGLIVKFDKKQIAGASGSLPTATFVLLDLQSGERVRIAPHTDPCLSAATRGDRFCIRLACDSAVCPVLHDGRSYLLYVDGLTEARTGKPLTPMPKAVPPVAGVVRQPASADRALVTIDFGLDLTGDTTDSLIIKVNHHVVRVVDPGGALQCYNDGLLGFNCRLDYSIRSGDRIDAAVVSRSTGQPVFGPIKSAVAKFSAVDSSTARFLIGGSWRTTDSQTTRSGSLLVHNVRLAEFGPLSGHTTIGPYVDFAASSDTADPGHFYVGAQSTTRLLFSATSLVPVVELAVTPRAETDKKHTVTNYIVFDGVITLGIRVLEVGRVVGVSYQFLPRVGYEIGSTQPGSGASRPEGDHPRRWKLGASLVLSVPPEVIRLPSWLPYAGFKVDGDVTEYRLQRPADPQRAALWRPRFRCWSAKATYKFTKAVGLSAGWKRGAVPPLFKSTRSADVGLTMMF